MGLAKVHCGATPPSVMVLFHPEYMRLAMSIFRELCVLVLHPSLGWLVGGKAHNAHLKYPAITASSVLAQHC